MSDTAFTPQELLARPDAKATLARLKLQVSPDQPNGDLVVALTALAVLRARAAAERRAEGARR